MESPKGEKVRVLLVDDEDRVLGALRRAFSQLSEDLVLEVASGGTEAIAKSQNGDFDIVISDLRMPVTDGEKVLGFVRRQNPDSLRVVLSGQASAEKLLDTLRVSHQYLEKPCPTKRLSSVMNCLAVLKRAKLPKIILKQILTMNSLPCDGALISVVRHQLQNGEATQNLDSVINSDLGMSIGLLRLLSIVSGGVVSPQNQLHASSLPSSLLSKFLDSHLLSPLFESDELLRAVRVTSIKANLMAHRLHRMGHQNKKMLAIVAYLGELALINSVGGDLSTLDALKGCRDEITKVVWSLWALPEEVLQLLSNSEFISARAEIDAFFPFNELAFLSHDEILEIFSEVLCLTE